MPTLRLMKGKELLCQNEWRGNIRQLRNIAEQCLYLKRKVLNSENLYGYLPNKTSKILLNLTAKTDSNHFHQKERYYIKFCLTQKRFK